MRTNTLALGTIAVGLAMAVAAQWSGQWDEADAASDLVASAEERARTRAVAATNASPTPSQTLATSAPSPESQATPASPVPDEAGTTVAVVKRSLSPMAADLFKAPPKPPVAVEAPPPAPPPVAPTPRFTVIGRVIDGPQRQVIIQDGQKVSTLTVGQKLAGFTLESVDDGSALFSGPPAVAGQALVRHKLEYGKAPVVRAGATPGSPVTDEAGGGS